MHDPAVVVLSRLGAHSVLVAERQRGGRQGEVGEAERRDASRLSRADGRAGDQ